MSGGGLVRCRPRLSGLSSGSRVPWWLPESSVLNAKKLVLCYAELWNAKFSILVCFGPRSAACGLYAGAAMRPCQVHPSCTLLMYLFPLQVLDDFGRSRLHTVVPPSALSRWGRLTLRSRIRWPFLLECLNLGKLYAGYPHRAIIVWPKNECISIMNVSR